MERIYCNTIIGTAAEGETYFARPIVEKLIVRQLKKGVFVHFTAPRRVGKTSILKAIANSEYEDMICIFENIESDRTSAELYKRLIKLISKGLSTKNTLWKKSLAYLKSKKVTGISLEGINLEHEKIDYKETFLKLVDSLKDNPVRIVLLVDEFPDVIANIHRNEGVEAALDVLNTIRSVRQTDKFKRAFGLVLSGSIGLTHVIRSFGRPKLINDLKIIALNPLDDKQCDSFIAFLTEEATLTIDEQVIGHIKEKLQQFIPYYIQLIIEGGDELTDNEGRKALTKEDVDLVYDSLTKENDKFIDWVDRIRDYYKSSFPFFKDVLTYTAHNNAISIQQIANFANDRAEKEYEELIHQVLIKDGYLEKSDDGFYRYSSPLLRDWWKYHYSH